MSNQQQSNINSPAFLLSSRTYIMGMASLLIIMFHWGGTATWLQRAINAYGYFGVEIFLFLSGYGICHSLLRKTSLITFYHRRMIRIFPTCIISGILLVMAWHTGAPALYSYSSLYFKLAFVGLDVWYIRTQLLFYLLAPFVFVVFVKYRYSLLLIALYSLIGFTLIYQGSPWHLNFQGENQFLWNTTILWSIKRFPAFLAGMFVAVNLREKVSFKTWGILAIGSGISFFALSGMQYAGIVSDNICNSFEIFLFPCWYYVVLFLERTLVCLPKLVTAAVEWVGLHSLEMFLTHAAIFACAKALFGRSIMVFACSCVVFVLAAILINRLSLAVTKKLT